MRAFIVSGRPNRVTGDAVYTLVAEDGEVLAQHICSHPSFAPGDLYGNRPERKPLFEAKGITAFLWLDDAPDMDEAELLRRNHARDDAA